MEKKRYDLALAIRRELNMDTKAPVYKNREYFSLIEMHEMLTRIRELKKKANNQ